MNEQLLIDEINKLINQFKTNNYDLDTMQLSFAIAVILMNQYGLTNDFNSLMELYNNHKNTIDVNPVEDNLIQVVKY